MNDVLDLTPADQTQETTDLQDLNTDVDPVESHDDQPAHQGSDSQQTDTDHYDGRRGPASIRNSIKAATEALPEQAQHFKDLGNAFYREQAYKQHFASPQEAATAKTLLESVGGIDGISRLQEREQLASQQDQFLRDGNPEVLTEFAKDFPEGFAALAPAYLEKLATVNPQAFQTAVAPYAFSLLQSTGFGDYLYAAANETDPDRVKQYVTALAQWFTEQKQGVSQLFQSRKSGPSPDEKRLQDERSQLEQEREAIFTGKISERINTLVNPEIEKIVGQYAKQNKFTEDQRVLFWNLLQQRVSEDMGKDETFTKQANIRRQQKDRTPDSIASYIATSFNSRLKDAALVVAKQMGARGNVQQQTNGVIKAGQPKSTPSGGFLKVSQRPNDSDMNMNHKDAEMWLIQGKALLKNGRKITWR